MKFGKRGLSEVIATILIILITIVSIGILAAVVIPYVRNNLDEGTSCIDITGGLPIIEEKS